MPHSITRALSAIAVVIAATGSTMPGGKAASSPRHAYDAEAASDCGVYVGVSSPARADIQIAYQWWWYQPPFRDVAYGNERGVYIRAGSIDSWGGQIPLRLDASRISRSSSPFGSTMQHFERFACPVPGQ